MKQREAHGRRASFEFDLDTLCAAKRGVVSGFAGQAGHSRFEFLVCMWILPVSVQVRGRGQRDRTGVASSLVTRLCCKGMTPHSTNIAIWHGVASGYRIKQANVLQNGVSQC